MEKSNFITAEEARMISGATVEDIINNVVMPAIKHKAENEERSIKLHIEPFVHGAYKNSKAYQKACKILVDLGYKVEFFYEVRQFVNMYTIVKW